MMDTDPKEAKRRMMHTDPEAIGCEAMCERGGGLYPPQIHMGTRNSRFLALALIG